MRIKGTAKPDALEGPIGEIGLAMALDGNGRWCYLDPSWERCTPWPSARARLQ